MKQTIYAYIGSYAEANDAGLYACSYDSELGELKLIEEISGLHNPTFLEVEPVNKRLYAISVDVELDKSTGLAIAYQIDQETGKLTLINKEKTVPASTCHISIDQTAQLLLSSSYHGGFIGMNSVLENGGVGPSTSVHQHSGSSIQPAQTQARVHSATIDPSNQFAVVCDLGTDQIHVYKLDRERQLLVPHSEVKLAAGAGPRHFSFHPQQPYGFVINELNSTVTSFAFDAEQGTLQEKQTISTLPADYTGDNACADIHISRDGRFLYGSNRGHDSIVVYAIAPEDAALTVIEHTSTLGGHPRNFALSPDDRFLLAANRDADNIVTFARDAETGRLSANGKVLNLSKPVCVKFLS